MSVEFPSIVCLNVGGVEYATSLDTLRKDPTSMLAAMFSGRIGVQMDDRRRYFIDRDGRRFADILNYLRDGSIPIPTCTFEQEALRAEANYFQIKGLIEILGESRRNEAATWGQRAVQAFRRENSVLLEGSREALLRLTSASATLGLEKVLMTIQLDDRKTRYGAARIHVVPRPFSVEAMTAINEIVQTADKELTEAGESIFAMAQNESITRLVLGALRDEGFAVQLTREVAKVTLTVDLWEPVEQVVDRTLEQIKEILLNASTIVGDNRREWHAHR